ncbi:bud neck involved protein [Microsporum canis]
MAALVQTIPQQAGTITLLQSRPASSSSFTTPIQHQSQVQNQTQMARNQNHTRPSYSGGNGPSAPTGYRMTQPVAPYAFTTTPGLPVGGSPAANVQRQTQAQTQPQTQNQNQNQNTLYPGTIPPRTHFSTAGSVSNSVSNSPSSNSSFHSHLSKDDSSLPRRQGTSELSLRPASAIDLTLPASLPAASTPSKPSPDRYRRGQRRGDQASSPVTTTEPNASSSLGLLNNNIGMTTAQAAKSLTPSIVDIPGKPRTQTARHTRGASADAAVTDDSSPSSTELAKRYRRRSMGSIETVGFINFPDSHPSPHANEMALSEFPLSGTPPPPNAADSASVTSSSGSVKSEKGTETSTSQPNKKTTPASIARPADTPKRSSTPSPLSKPVNIDTDETLMPTTSSKPTSETRNQTPNVTDTPSPAAKRLIEISKKGQGKGSKSRLRRALSFSSVAELRGISTPEPTVSAPRKQQLDEELSPEQAAIAAKQEAGGLGESIYSGQGNIFTGSTDNISVSSTASSASIMLRKMGNGVKRSTRSLVGLFRPKSVYNTPTDTSRIAAPVPQVSMVTVEAQRDAVGKGPPVLPEVSVARQEIASERRSVESDASGNADRNARKSIFGGDQERAEVLAAVRKGILKKSGTNSSNSSPNLRPTTDLAPVPTLQRPVSQRSSSAPSSSAGDRPPRSGHRRTDSVTIEGEDYFLPAGRFTTSGQSAPGTPQSTTGRNISFSPRIQFHDTWPSGEYDRRGDVATCNRLTPLLAQQIKEELNTFKMEMEVHESSKVYTHFF